MILSEFNFDDKRNTIQIAGSGDSPKYVINMDHDRNIKKYRELFHIIILMIINDVFLLVK